MAVVVAEGQVNSLVGSLEFLGLLLVLYVQPNNEIIHCTETNVFIPRLFLVQILYGQVGNGVLGGQPWQQFRRGGGYQVKFNYAHDPPTLVYFPGG